MNWKGFETKTPCSDRTTTTTTTTTTNNNNNNTATTNTTTTTTTTTTNNNNNINSIKLFIIYVLSQQPQGQLHAQHSVDKSSYMLDKQNLK
jgi:hypothetical protein